MTGLSGKKVLITGATGLVGSHLAKELLSQGAEVHALIREGRDPSFMDDFLESPGLHSRIKWVKGDLLDYFSLLDAIKDIDIIFHAAAEVSFKRSDRNRIMETNATGTANLVNACLELHKPDFIHISSVAALGRDKSDDVISEENTWKDSSENSYYAISKFKAEREVWRAAAEGLNVGILNPSIILGPSRWEQGSSKLFLNIFKGMPFYPGGSNAYVDVRDVARAAVLIAEQKIFGERFILASENLSYRDLFSGIAKSFGKKPPHIFAKPFITEIYWRLDHIKTWISGKDPVLTKETARTSQKRNLYSNEKIKKKLGFSFIPIHQSIEDTCRIFLKTFNPEQI